METSFGIARIREILPHRYPFLFVDKVLETNGEDHIVALKNVTADEPFFQGHFPGNPVFPGVLQIETMAQAAGLIQLWKTPKDAPPPILMSIMSAKFRRPVVPGDAMLVEVRQTRMARQGPNCIARYEATIRVDGETASEATFLCMLPKLAEAPAAGTPPSNETTEKNP